MGADELLADDEFLVDLLVARPCCARSRYMLSRTDVLIQAMEANPAVAEVLRGVIGSSELKQAVSEGAMWCRYQHAIYVDTNHAQVTTGTGSRNCSDSFSHNCTNLLEHVFKEDLRTEQARNKKWRQRRIRRKNFTVNRGIMALAS